MAIYTSAQLQGAGSAGFTLLNTPYTYQFTLFNPGNSSYFFLESNRNNNGTYSTSGSTFGVPCALGSWTDNTVGGLVSDKYIMGCVVPPGTSSITFTPDSSSSSILSTRYKFRGTGTFTMSSSLDLSFINPTNAFNAGNPSSYPGSGSLWTNLSGSTNATLFNGVVYSTNGSGSLAFDGVNDYVSIPYNTNFNFSSGNYGINMWIKIGNVGGGLLTQKSNDSLGNPDWYFNLDSSLASITGYSSNPPNDTPVFPLSPALNINTWYLISITSTSNIASIYINGVQKGTSLPYAPGNTVNVNPLYNYVYLMNEPILNTPLSGSLGLVEYYSATFGPTQILSYFNSTKTRFGY